MKYADALKVLFEKSGKGSNFEKEYFLKRLWWHEQPRIAKMKRSEEEFKKFFQKITKEAFEKMAKDGAYRPDMAALYGMYEQKMVQKKQRRYRRAYTHLNSHEKYKRCLEDHTTVTMEAPF